MKGERFRMSETLHEDDPSMVILQKRAFKAEPDIVALDRYGNLVVGGDSPTTFQFTAA